MREPAFQLLRVEKNLGYKVELVCEVNLVSILGITFTVTSQSNMFTGSAIKKEMDAFIRTFYDSRLLRLNKEEFKALKSCFGVTTSNAEQVFKEIVKNELLFDRAEAEVRV
jgi:secreted Zn-dependent insulinase-like peptidase